MISGSTTWSEWRLALSKSFSSVCSNWLTDFLCSLPSLSIYNYVTRIFWLVMFSNILLLSLFFSQDGVTPLLMASQNGHTTTVSVLIRSGADPNIADQVKRTANFYIQLLLSDNYTHWQHHIIITEYVIVVMLIAVRVIVGEGSAFLASGIEPSMDTYSVMFT